MSLLGATILTAVATAVLAVGAIVTAVLAWLAFRKQSREVAAIEQQVSDQKDLTAQQAKLLEVQAGQLELQRRQFEQEQADRRRAQASRIFFTVSRGDKSTTQVQRATGVPDPGNVTVRVTNTSQQPVYDLRICWRKDTAAWGEDGTAEILMPEASAVRMHPFPDGLPATVDRSLFGAVVRFRDAAGVRWLLRPDGQLAEEAPSS